MSVRRPPVERRRANADQRREAKARRRRARRINRGGKQKRSALRLYLMGQGIDNWARLAKLYRPGARATSEDGGLRPLPKAAVDAAKSKLGKDRPKGWKV